MLKSITVAELRELLEGEPDDKRVVFASDYGDHGHTMQAVELEGETEDVRLEESGYSKSGWAVRDTERWWMKDEDDDEDMDDEVFLLIK